MAADVLDRPTPASGEPDSGAPALDGVVVVDKPAGWTSHDVVSRIRRLAGTRRVGHAGTLDPMATGVLVVGIGRATRLLGHISGHHKAYAATIRLGWATVTDDAEGERLDGAPADVLELDDLLPAVEALTGPILQRPAAVSAIKVQGRRAHDRVRSGEEVQLPARPVLVSVFDVVARRPVPEVGALDLDVEVECSSGTYVRALARDLGAALGVGGHLTALRRIRVGGFEIDEARTLDDLAAEREATGRISVLGLADAAGSAFPVLSVPESVAVAVRNGRPIDLSRSWAPYRDLAAGDPDMASTRATGPAGAAASGTTAGSDTASGSDAAVPAGATGSDAAFGSDAAASAGATGSDAAFGSDAAVSAGATGSDAAFGSDAAAPAGATGSAACAGSWADHVEAHALFSEAGQFLALVAPNADATTRYLAVFAAP